MKMIPLRAIAGLALTVFFALSATLVPAAERNGKARRIEGTWSVQITARNCETGAEIISFPTKITFLAGGDTIVTTSVSFPFLRSTGHGVWEHTGGRTFVGAVEPFVYAQDHTFIGIEKVKQKIELSESGDEFTSTNTFELPLPNGQVMRGCSTGVGRRMEVE